MAMAKGFVLDLHHRLVVVDSSGGLFATCIKYATGE